MIFTKINQIGIMRTTAIRLPLLTGLEVSRMAMELTISAHCSYIPRPRARALPLKKTCLSISSLLRERRNEHRWIAEVKYEQTHS